MPLVYEYDDFCEEITIPIASYSTVSITSTSVPSGTYRAYNTHIDARNYYKDLPDGTLNVQGSEVNHFDLTMTISSGTIRAIGSITISGNPENGVLFDFGNVSSAITYEREINPSNTGAFPCIWILAKDDGNLAAITGITLKCWIGYGTVRGHYLSGTSFSDVMEYDGYPVNFGISFPKDYGLDTEKRYPLVLSTAGSGTEGCDGENMLLYKVLLGAYLSTTWYRTEDYDCISIVFERPPTDNSCGCPTEFPARDYENGWIAGAVTALAQKFIDSYQVDEDRVYLSGFSQGALDLWPILFEGRDLWCSAWINYDPGSGAGRRIGFSKYEDYIISADNWPTSGQYYYNSLYLWRQMVQRINHMNIWRFDTHAPGGSTAWPDTPVVGSSIDLEIYLFEQSGGTGSMTYVQTPGTHNVEITTPASSTLYMDALFSTSRGVVPPDPYPNVGYEYIIVPTITFNYDNVYRVGASGIPTPLLTGGEVDANLNIEITGDHYDYDSVAVNWTTAGTTTRTPTSGSGTIAHGERSFSVVLNTTLTQKNTTLTFSVTSLVPDYGTPVDVIYRPTTATGLTFRASGYANDRYFHNNTLETSYQLDGTPVTITPLQADYFRLNLYAGESLRVYPTGGLIDLILASSSLIGFPWFLGIHDGTIDNVVIYWLIDEEEESPWVPSESGFSNKWFEYRTEEDIVATIITDYVSIKTVSHISSFENGIQLEYWIGLKLVGTTDLSNHLYPFKLITEVPNHTYSVSLNGVSFDVMDDGNYLIWDVNGSQRYVFDKGTNDSIIFKVGPNQYFITYVEDKPFEYLDDFKEHDGYTYGTARAFTVQKIDQPYYIKGASGVLVPCDILETSETGIVCECINADGTEGSKIVNMHEYNGAYIPAVTYCRNKT